MKCSRYKPTDGFSSERLSSYGARDPSVAKSYYKSYLDIGAFGFRSSLRASALLGKPPACRARIAGPLCWHTPSRAKVYRPSLTRSFFSFLQHIPAIFGWPNGPIRFGNFFMTSPALIKVFQHPPLCEHPKFHVIRRSRRNLNLSTIGFLLFLMPLGVLLNVPADGLPKFPSWSKFRNLIQMEQV